jgi:hypothetical protein
MNLLLIQTTSSNAYPYTVEVRIAWRMLKRGEDCFFQSIYTVFVPIAIACILLGYCWTVDRLMLYTVVPQDVKNTLSSTPQSTSTYLPISNTLRFDTNLPIHCVLDTNLPITLCFCTNIQITAAGFVSISKLHCRFLTE